MPDDDKVIVSRLDDLIKQDLFCRDGKLELMKTPKGRLIPDHSQWAQCVINTFATATNNQIIYVYDKSTGCFSDGEGTVKEWMERQFLDFTLKDFAEIFNHVKNRTYLPDDRMEIVRKENKNKLLLKNGVYDLVTGELSAFSSNFCFFSAPLPVTYSSDAGCPNFLQFLSEVAKPGDVPTIQEMFGYCLTRDYKLNKAFMFIGEGANGKTTLLNTLVALLGKENVTSVDLQKLQSDKFEIVKLRDKYANIIMDLAAKALYDVSIFKTLTGEDLVSARMMHSQKDCKFYNHAKMIFSANEAPACKQTTNAFWRRWILLSFSNVFLGPSRDKNKLAKITTPEELSGILNWALGGLKRLEEKGEFSVSQSAEETQRLWEKTADPLAYFARECIEVSGELTVSKADFYSAFSQFCREEKVKAIDEMKVKGSLLKMFPGCYDERVTKARTMQWVGIGLNDKGMACLARARGSTGNEGAFPPENKAYSAEDFLKMFEPKEASP